MNTDDLSFALFVTVFCGGLAALTLGMLWVAVVLYRQNRHRFPHPARVLPFIPRAAREG
jgi:hypothetical protein